MSRWRESSGLSFGSQIVPPGVSSCGNACDSRTRFSKSAYVASRRSRPSRTNGQPYTAPNAMCLPPMWIVCAGLRAWRSNSRGAFATCSRIQSGSSLTSWPSTFWPAASSSGDRLLVRLRRAEVDAELADDAPPAALELLHGRLVEDLVARHLVDQQAVDLPGCLLLESDRLEGTFETGVAGLADLERQAELRQPRPPPSRSSCVGRRAARARRRARSCRSSRRAAPGGGRARGRARRRGRTSARGNRSGSTSRARERRSRRRARSSRAPARRGRSSSAPRVPQSA